MSGPEVLDARHRDLLRRERLADPARAERAGGDVAGAHAPVAVLGHEPREVAALLLAERGEGVAQRLARAEEVDDRARGVAQLLEGERAGGALLLRRAAHPGRAAGPTVAPRPVAPGLALPPRPLAAAGSTLLLAIGALRGCGAAAGAGCSAACAALLGRGLLWPRARAARPRPGSAAAARRGLLRRGFGLLGRGGVPGCAPSGCSALRARGLLRPPGAGCLPRARAARPRARAARPRARALGAGGLLGRGAGCSAAGRGLLGWPVAACSRRAAAGLEAASSPAGASCFSSVSVGVGSSAIAKQFVPPRARRCIAAGQPGDGSAGKCPLLATLAACPKPSARPPPTRSSSAPSGPASSTERTEDERLARIRDELVKGYRGAGRAGLRGRRSSGRPARRPITPTTRSRARRRDASARPASRSSPAAARGSWRPRTAGRETRA